MLLITIEVELGAALVVHRVFVGTRMVTVVVEIHEPLSGAEVVGPESLFI